ncbi:MAG TPA: DoxX family protein [Ferruginibacter sp.]|nr:DoxX family protein [Ferruginibacter sp.]
MGLLHQMNEWSAKHHPKWLVILRVALGLCLFIKGFEFIQNSVILSDVISQTPFIKNATWLASLIPWLHLLGGSLILVGLFTRLSCLIQIPILLGAVFFVNARQGIISGGSDLMFSVIILILLVFFFVEGGGPISMDNYFRNYSKINREH